MFLCQCGAAHSAPGLAGNAIAIAIGARRLSRSRRVLAAAGETLPGDREPSSYRPC